MGGGGGVNDRFKQMRAYKTKSGIDYNSKWYCFLVWFSLECTRTETWLFFSLSPPFFILPAYHSLFLSPSPSFLSPFQGEVLLGPDEGPQAEK